jgi:protein-S-isoprenylcysteine O-methyltransferase Ste14
MARRPETIFAFFWGILSHATFVVAVAVMIWDLYNGMRTGIGPFHGWRAILVNTILIVQFPVIHSFLLTPTGRRVLSKIAPGDLGRDLTPTTFALVASIQTLATFLLWSPSGVTLYDPHGGALWTFRILFALSWLFLGKAMIDARLGVQTGYIGWSSVVRGKKPDFGNFPTHGLFRWCRQPVYLGFALTLWTAPVHTVDGIVLALVWTAYCFAAPMLKEMRYLGWYGESFARYRASVPYMFPRMK